MKKILVVMIFIGIGFGKVATAMPVSQKSRLKITPPELQEVQPMAYVSSALNELMTGQFNVNSHLFMDQQFAMSLAFANKSETAKPLDSDNLNSDPDVKIDTTQFSVGTVYYLNEQNLKTNVSLNPYLVFQRQSDLEDVKNYTGLGLRLDGQYKIKKLVFNTGLLSQIINGDSDSKFQIGLGYIL